MLQRPCLDHGAMNTCKLRSICCPKASYGLICDTQALSGNMKSVRNLTLFAHTAVLLVSEGSYTRSNPFLRQGRRPHWQISWSLVEGHILVISSPSGLCVRVSGARERGGGGGWADDVPARRR